MGMNSDNVRNPCPIGPPNGDSAVARSGSTWIHWWSSVASANVFTRSCVTSNHSLTPSTCPFSEGSSASVVVVLLLIQFSSVFGFGRTYQGEPLPPTGGQASVAASALLPPAGAARQRAARLTAS